MGSGGVAKGLICRGLISGDKGKIEGEGKGWNEVEKGFLEEGVKWRRKGLGEWGLVLGLLIVISDVMVDFDLLKIHCFVDFVALHQLGGYPHQKQNHHQTHQSLLPFPKHFPSQNSPNST